MTRVRSPNYPAFSLGAALDRARAIHKAEGKNAVAREAIAKHMGFGGLNGASATALSALGKFGLIENASDGEARITDLAMRILFPHTPEEKQAALEEAAFKPVLFAELREKWPDRAPTDESLRSYLVRRGFSEGALEQVIQFYRETLDIAVPKVGLQASPAENKNPGVQMSDAPLAASVIAPTATSAALSGRPFNVSYDGAILTGTLALRSPRDIDRLVKVLNAQKAAMEAMAEDEDSDGPDDEDRTQALDQ